MSYIFDIDDETVWSPSLRVGRMFVELARCTSALWEIETGLIRNASDMYEINLDDFKAFTDRLLQEYFSTDHPIYRDQLRGVLMPSVVLLERGGIPVDYETPEQKRLLSHVSDYAKMMPR
ncbi:hypothetical protein ACZ90_31705 [Streptomyces albus subsp. albus]|nr:hypothetical protein ACZ90_31705 [Streptomyces albus subsp. albus]